MPIVKQKSITSLLCGVDLGCRLHIKTFVKFAILSYCKLTQVNYYVQVLKCNVHTPQKSVIYFILALQINVLTQFGRI